jgi:thymidylate synthase (FAD)
MSYAVELIHHTFEAEKVMAYCARVSSSNQENPNLDLLKYCIKHGHWSVFEMASMCLEITTSRGIAPQILRHRSFSFQEFSQRYAIPKDVCLYEPRRQDDKNRQSSHDDLPPEIKAAFKEIQQNIWNTSQLAYQWAMSNGIAKESARFLLPMNTQTRLYMHGSVRSWIHYIQLRTTPGTQKEHRDIALAAQRIFATLFPITAEALDWPKAE